MSEYNERSDYLPIENTKAYNPKKGHIPLKINLIPNQIWPYFASHLLQVLLSYSHFIEIDPIF